MRITEASIHNRATIFFLTAAVVVAGTFAYRTLPRENSPDVSVPLILVYTLYPGASPADVESQVTQPLERELQGIDGLKELTSTSQESVSLVNVELVSGIDIETARQKVRDRVDRAKVDLPEDAEEPILEEVTFSDLPILQISLSGQVGQVVLKQLAEDLQDRLEAIPGVLRVNLVGGLEREVQVNVDPQRLQLYGLALKDVVEAVEKENVSIPGGDMDLGDLSYAIRVPGEIAEPREVADFVIRQHQGRPIFVRDVAQVAWGFKDRGSYARIDGREAVSLTVQKRLGANILEVVEKVKAEVAEEGRGWPEGVTATFLADQSEDVGEMLSDLENSILTGLLLVVAVLMFAMGLRNAVFVGVAIPLSMLVCFVAIQATGSTLNMVILFSLVLSVGMLVDNAVVVVENIYRHMQEGKERLAAAVEASREVDAAILVSTLTTVGAFFPLLFWPGVVGDFMIYLPMTVSLALLASLTVAFTMNPVFCAVFMRVSRRDQAAGSERRPGLLGRAGSWVSGFYQAVLGWALDHRGLTLALTLGAFGATLFLYAAFSPGVEYFPDVDPSQIVVDVETEAGTRLERTDALLRTLEGRLDNLPDVKVAAAGSGSGSQAEFGLSGGGGATQGRLTLDLVERPDRQQSSALTLEEARHRTYGLAGATVTVKKQDVGPPVGKPLSIEVSGRDFATLGAVAGRIREAIGDIPGLVSLDDDFDLARPEVVVRLDRTQVARLGLTTEDVAATVRTAVQGTEASTYRYGEDEADITVRLASGSRDSLEELGRLTVVAPGGAQVPLSSLATIERQSALTSIRHKDRKRVVTVSGDVLEPPLAEPVRTEARQRLAAIPDLLPAGVSLAFTGQSDDEDETKAFLSKAFLYAVLLVLALLVAKFNSLGIPLIILTSVVMSLVGVLLGLLIMDLPFGIIMTGLGVISLAGVVVNNAIVLLDYAEQLRAAGLPRREVVMLTGLRRLRPVLLTAITTILGLIPLAAGFELDVRHVAITAGGESSEWWRSMAVAVIFGLAFATFLTLVLVPVLYDLLLSLRERWEGRRTLGAPPASGGPRRVDDPVRELPADEEPQPRPEEVPLGV